VHIDSSFLFSFFFFPSSFPLLRLPSFFSFLLQWPTLRNPHSRESSTRPRTSSPLRRRPPRASLARHPRPSVKCSPDIRMLIRPQFRPMPLQPTELPIPMLLHQRSDLPTILLP
ncbi:hypothetical protein PENTCL1PPCAC_2831, partial [Pristionchus entomophagus]